MYKREAGSEGESWSVVSTRFDAATGFDLSHLGQTRLPSGSLPELDHARAVWFAPTRELAETFGSDITISELKGMPAANQPLEELYSRLREPVQMMRRSRTYAHLIRGCILDCKPAESDRNIDIYRKAHGVGTPRASQTELSKQYNLRTARIDQVVRRIDRKLDYTRPIRFLPIRIAVLAAACELGCAGSVEDLSERLEEYSLPLEGDVSDVFQFVPEISVDVATGRFSVPGMRSSQAVETNPKPGSPPQADVDKPRTPAHGKVSAITVESEAVEEDSQAEKSIATPAHEGTGSASATSSQVEDARRASESAGSLAGDTKPRDVPGGIQAAPERSAQKRSRNAAVANEPIAFDSLSGFDLRAVKKGPGKLRPRPEIENAPAAWFASTKELIPSGDTKTPVKVLRKRNDCRKALEALYEELGTPLWLSQQARSYAQLVSQCVVDLRPANSKRDIDMFQRYLGIGIAKEETADIARYYGTSPEAVESAVHGIEAGLDLAQSLRFLPLRIAVLSAASALGGAGSVTALVKRVDSFHLHLSGDLSEVVGLVPDIALSADRKGFLLKDMAAAGRLDDGCDQIGNPPVGHEDEPAQDIANGPEKSKAEGEPSFGVESRNASVGTIEEDGISSLSEAQTKADAPAPRQAESEPSPDKAESKSTQPGARNTVIRRRPGGRRQGPVAEIADYAVSRMKESGEPIVDANGLYERFSDVLSDAGVFDAAGLYSHLKRLDDERLKLGAFPWIVSAAATTAGASLSELLVRGAVESGTMIRLDETGVLAERIMTSRTGLEAILDESPLTIRESRGWWPDIHALQPDKEKKPAITAEYLASFEWELAERARSIRPVAGIFYPREELLASPEELTPPSEAGWAGTPFIRVFNASSRFRSFGELGGCIVDTEQIPTIETEADFYRELLSKNFGGEVGYRTFAKFCEENGINSALTPSFLDGFPGITADGRTIRLWD